MWVPELPFQMRCQREPELAGRPLAFRNPEEGRVATLWFLNRVARSEGLRVGDTVDQALQRVRGLRVLDPEPQTWWEAQASLEAFCLRWTPQGQLGRMGEALVELAGTEGISGPPRDAARRMRRELQASHGWISHGGLSRSATAAALAAHLEHELEWVEEGEERVFLAPQPLRQLRELSPRLQERFWRLGLSTFGDAQPLGPEHWRELVPAPLALRLRSQVRGEDRPRLPLLGERPGSSRHPWRLEPPRLPQEVGLAAWVLTRLWEEPRHPRKLALRWWDVDGTPHFWRAAEEVLALPALRLAKLLEEAFLNGATRRLLVREVELRVAWGLGRPRPLFQDPRDARLEHLEGTLSRLRRRYPESPVRPAWQGPVGIRM